MPYASFLKQFKEARLFRSFPRLAGALAIFSGIAIIISWHAHWSAVLQWVSGSAAMQYNTALCFILCGLGLYLLTGQNARMAPWFSGLAALFCGATIFEYISGRDLGIDQVFLKPYFNPATTYPGRMSPLAAICFIFIGVGIMLAGTKGRWPQRMTGAGLLAAIVTVVALVAMFGYAFGIDAAYGWGADSRMAVNTAAVFLFLGMGLLIQAWQMARAENFNFLRWLPVTGSVTLMMMVAFVSAVNLAELKKATFWRKHTIDVILAGQGFEENLIDMQRGVRGYALFGDANGLAAYRTALELEPKLLEQLTELTRDNPAQQKQLKALAQAMNDVFDYDKKTVALYEKEGAAAVLKTDTNGLSRAVFGNARNILKKFSKDEQVLLTQRENSEEGDSNNAVRLLIFGSVVAALLLILANSMASRELRHRRRVEFTLRDTMILQDAMLSSANYAIICLDAKGVVRTFNPAAEQMLGYRAEEVVGKATPMLWRDPEEVTAQARKMTIEQGRLVKPDVEILTHRSMKIDVDEYEVTYIRKDKSRFPVLVSLTALKDYSGKVTGYLGVIADITERKRTNAALAELQRQNERILTSVGEGLHGIDRDGKIIFENPAATKLLGWEENELIGQPAHAIMHHMRANGLEYPLKACHIHATMKDGVVRRVDDEVFWRKDGSCFPVTYTATPILDENKAIVGVVVAFRDITERKKADAALRESEERFRSAFDDAPIGMALVSIAGKWLKVNHGLCAMLGYTEAEMLKTDFQHITHPDDLEKDLELVEQVLTGKINSYQMEKRYYDKHGMVVFVNLSVSMVHDDADQPLYFVSQVENITERKLRETEREKLIGDLQTALADVKTLSGLIPICGWCKSVRTDGGYWQSVELYVRAKTDATFSHGMCPTCAEKMKSEILKANADSPKQT